MSPGCKLSKDKGTSGFAHHCIPITWHTTGAQVVYVEKRDRSGTHAVNLAAKHFTWLKKLFIQEKSLDIASKSNVAKSKHSINTGWMDGYMDAWRDGWMYTWMHGGMGVNV